MARLADLGEDRLAPARNEPGDSAFCESPPIILIRKQRQYVKQFVVSKCGELFHQVGNWFRWRRSRWFPARFRGIGTLFRFD
jgi:hypothetical protein